MLRSEANIRHVFPVSICINALPNGGQYARTSPIWFGLMGRDFMLLKSCQLNQVTPISPFCLSGSLTCLCLFSIPALQPTATGNCSGNEPEPSSAPEHEMGIQWPLWWGHPQSSGTAGWGWEKHFWGESAGKQREAGLHPPQILPWSEPHNHA